MASFSENYIRVARNILPMPFTIAIALTVVTFIIGCFLYDPIESEHGNVIDLLLFWEKGLWNTSLLAFATQGMLMLVLGYALALTKPVNRLVSFLTKYTTNTASSVFIVTIFSILFGWLNWGLGLIIGAVLARKVGEHCQKKKIAINYPIIGAAGYVGMMIWHGGLSGTAPLKVSESGHFFEEEIGVIASSETLFSPMNIFCTAMVFVCLPLAFYLLAKKVKSKPYSIKETYVATLDEDEDIVGAEKLDHSYIVASLFGVIILGIACYKLFVLGQDIGLNTINFILLGLAILLHKNFAQFIKAVDISIGSAAGILIQFPLYFGIMGIMKDAGLAKIFSDFFVSISTQFTYPIYTFLSAGIVNVFVPSGGGQWAVQGKIIIEAAKSLDVSVSKSIMAMAYGDQLTNMLQPFWALPLLGITGLKAKDILPYTLYIMLVGSIIFLLTLMLF